MITVKNTIYLLLMCLLGYGFTKADTITLSFPDTTAFKGDTLLVPLYASEITGEDGVLSGEFTIGYDNRLVSIFGIKTEGTIMDIDDPVLFNATTRRFAFAASDTVSGEGVFVYFRVAVHEDPTISQSSLQIQNLLFNEGEPEGSVVNGSIRYRSVSMTPKAPSFNMTPGSTFKFNLVGDVVGPVQWSVSDTDVGSVDEDGLFTALAPGQVRLYAVDAQGLQDSTNLFRIFSETLTDLTISIPNAAREQTLTFDLPVYVSDVTGLEIYSVQMRLTYNGNHLQVLDVYNDGSMTDTWGTPAFNVVHGATDIAMAGASELEGEGVLFYVRFRVSASASGSSTMSAANILFNEDITADVESGTFTAIPAPVLVIEPSTATITRDDTIEFQVTSGGTPPYVWTSSNPDVASIDPQTGVLTAHTRGTVNISVEDSLGFSKTSGDITVTDVEISLPVTYLFLDVEREIEVSIDDVTGLGIFAYEIDIVYDQDIIVIENVLRQNSISEDFAVVFNAESGTLQIAAAGTTELSGEGVLLRIVLSAREDTEIGTVTPLILQRAIFNEPGLTTPTAKKTNGELTILEPEPPGVPGDQHPPDGATDVPIPVILDWEDVPFASYYIIEIALDPGFINIVFDETTNESNITIHGLDYETTYYWRIRSGNVAGESDWTDGLSFTTRSAPVIPDAPVLVSPENEVADLERELDFIWRSVTDAEKYHFQLSESQDFDSPVYESSELTDTTVTVSDLAFNTTYHWRVNASNIAGTGEWSEIWSFTTMKLEIPDIPTDQQPPDGATDVPIPVTLDWEDVPFASYYRIVIALDPDFINIIIEESTDESQIIIYDLDYETTYYWRIRSGNDAGESDWTTGRSFTTKVSTSVDGLLTGVPNEYYLEQNYPNPFNPSTVIRYGLSERSIVKLEVYNMLGQRIATLVNDVQEAQSYEVTWYAAVPSGNYIYRLEAVSLINPANRVVMMNTMVLIK